MRVGCFGCLALTLLILVVLVAVLGVLFLSGNILDAPETTPSGKFGRSDGYSAQQKLYEIVLRQTDRSTRRDPIVLSETEVNAFLANHLAEAADLPLKPISVKFTGGLMEVQGQTALRNLLQGPPLPQLMPYVPQAKLDHPVWVTVRGRVKIEIGPAGATRNYGKVELVDFSLGKQPLGTWLLSLMLGSTGSRLLRWQVPGVVQEVQIDDGRIIIRTR